LGHDSACCGDSENQTVADNQSVTLTNIFSVSGTGITHYQVWFSYAEGGAPALGTVTNTGTPIALDQTVTLGSLGGLAYTGSAAHGTDKIWLKAFNGSWSGWTEADITDPGLPAPSIAPNNQAVADNQIVPLTNIFSVNGSGITQYQVWFSYAEGGAPALGKVTSNGTPIALDQPVTLGSLGGLAYTGSAVHGTDKIWLKAFNGSWSGWTEADITDPGLVSGINSSVLTPGSSPAGYSAEERSRTATLSLLSIYMASSFATSLDGHASSLDQSAYSSDQNVFLSKSQH
jgi:hypothetical protein